MNLDLFKDLINYTKENKLVQSFIKELGEFLEKNLSEEKLVNNERNQLSLLQKIQTDTKLTVEYRDKMHIERSNILNNYAKETFDEGTMYFIYSKNSRNENSYNSCICEEGKSNKVVEIEENQLPKGAGVDSVLREKNGKYILDKVATEEVQEQMTEMVNRLLKEQTMELEEQRVEGHIYEFVEKSGDTVWLIDRTKNEGNCFEEVEFPTEVMSNATEGQRIQYVNGEYQLYNT